MRPYCKRQDTREQSCVPSWVGVAAARKDNGFLYLLKFPSLIESAAAEVKWNKACFVFSLQETPIQTHCVFFGHTGAINTPPRPATCGFCSSCRPQCSPRILQKYRNNQTSNYWAIVLALEHMKLNMLVSVKWVQYDFFGAIFKRQNRYTCCKYYSYILTIRIYPQTRLEKNVSSINKTWPLCPFSWQLSKWSSNCAPPTWKKNAGNLALPICKNTGFWLVFISANFQVEWKRQIGRLLSNAVHWSISFFVDAPGSYIVTSSYECHLFHEPRLL